MLREPSRIQEEECKFHISHGKLNQLLAFAQLLRGHGSLNVLWVISRAYNHVLHIWSESY